MSRRTTAALAALLLLGATPVLAADEQASPEATAEATPEATPAIPQATLDPQATQQIGSPEVGLSLTFPADWRLSLPQGTRISEVTDPDGGPILATTAIMAMGQGGQWCDVDTYLDMPATLQEHALALAAYLQQKLGSVPMVVTQTALPAGEAYRVEVYDPATGRYRAHYIFDGLTAADGTTNRFVLTCATPSDAESVAQAVAETATLSQPVANEAPSAVPSVAPSGSPSE